MSSQALYPAIDQGTAPAKAQAGILDEEATMKAKRMGFALIAADELERYRDDLAAEQVALGKAMEEGP
jgi:hypothetical protein